MDWRADFNCGPMEAPHTGGYLWGHIISLCEALHARRIVDIGCGNGALCRELGRAADTKSSVANRAPRVFTSHSLERRDWYFTGWESMTIRL